MLRTTGNKAEIRAMAGAKAILKAGPGIRAPKIAAREPMLLVEAFERIRASSSLLVLIAERF